MARIFISYRRQDSKAIAGRIYDRLEAKYGRDALFMDIDSIPPGVDFHDWLSDNVAKASVVLVLIGRGWIDARDGGGNRRLEAPNDFVRIEIEAALTRNIPVIPLLIDGAPFPSIEQLPASLRPLSRRNAAFLDAGRDFNVHIARLIEAVEVHLKQRNDQRPKGSQQPKQRLYQGSTAERACKSEKVPVIEDVESIQAAVERHAESGGRSAKPQPAPTETGSSNKLLIATTAVVAVLVVAGLAIWHSWPEESSAAPKISLLPQSTPFDACTSNNPPISCFWRKP